MRVACVIAALLFCTSVTAAEPHHSSVLLEEMTWKEVRAALKEGKTTVIVPTGGTEQNGPHIVLGKHNFILEYSAMEIARRLGNALTAPIIMYVPEGDIHPPTGHMKFSGTLSLRPETFAAVLEDTARSLKEHGFTRICFIGEHGASQAVQRQVAEKLSTEWAGDHVQVMHINQYYDADKNGQLAWFKKVNEQEPDPEAHAGLADTAEMLAVHPQGVRDALRTPHSATDFETTGAEGSSKNATRIMGAKLVELKVNGAVTQIQAAEKSK